jgi:hypothetical protein
MKPDPKLVDRLAVTERLIRDRVELLARWAEGKDPPRERFPRESDPCDPTKVRDPDDVERVRKDIADLEGKLRHIRLLMESPHLVRPERPVKARPVRPYPTPEDLLEERLATWWGWVPPRP